jgi:RNA polymerase sigma factor (sigma-70 family)
MKVVLFSDSINLIEHWEKALHTKRKFKVIEELGALLQIKEHIVIVNKEALGKSLLPILKILNENKNRVLLLDRVPELEMAKRVLNAGAYGYGNALMREHFIVSAVNALNEEMNWLYPELTSMLIREIPNKHENNNSTNTLLEKLTAREREVALLLRDGLRYNEIAQKLNIKPRTVKAHAHSIYEKLSVEDRVGLALLLK